VTLERERLDHLCHQRRLRRHLLVTDCNRLVQIGAGGKLGGHEHESPQHITDRSA